MSKQSEEKGGKRDSSAALRMQSRLRESEQSLEYEIGSILSGAEDGRSIEDYGKRPTTKIRQLFVSPIILRLRKRKFHCLSRLRMNG